MTNLHDIILERKLIGALMLAPSNFGRVSSISEDTFSDESNARAWRLILRAYLAGQALSPSSLWAFNRAEVMHLGGMDAMESFRQAGKDIITDIGPVSQKLHELYQWRQLNGMANFLIAEAKKQNRNPEDLLSKLIEKSGKVLAEGQDSSRGKRDVIRSALSRVSEPGKQITTGLSSLDFLMSGGPKPRRLYGIGGLYGRGKTILLGSISDAINLQQIPHLMISLETDPEDIEIRNCAKHFEANASLLIDPNSSDHAELMSSASDYIDRVPEHTWFEFSPRATMDEIHRMILRAKARHGIQGFMVDYWQLIEGREKGQSEEAHHKSNANRLAAICRQENLWGFVTAQVDGTGKLKYSDSLLHAAALYIRFAREEDGMDVTLEVEKSNYSRYSGTSQAALPAMVFDPFVGPHFRNLQSDDAQRIAEQKTEGQIYL